MKLLHLGCGKKYFDGWINVDKVICHPDVIEDDVSILEKFDDDSIDLIYASHVLEHFGRHQVEDVICCWRNKLKRGGILRIAVPNFKAVCQRYNDTGSIEEILGLVCGGQRNVYDYHKVIFDFKMLKNMLIKMGFDNIHEYDWKETEHANIDDYSQSYLPHMQKQTGILMSLNVEARKV